MQAVKKLVELSHKCNCGQGQDHCRDAFVKKMKDSMVPSDTVVHAAQRFWKSFDQNCAGREFCRMINQATRSADLAVARPVACVARAINFSLVNVDPGFSGTCWRGGGLPYRYKSFFELHKGQKIRIPNYFATASKDGEVVNKFLGFAKQDNFPCVKWEIDITTHVGSHVKFIENSAEGLEDEHEVLFVPYWVFTIVNIVWSANPTPDNPHRIKMLAAEDNSSQEEDLPLAPWS